MPREVFELLQEVYVAGQQMKIKKATGPLPAPVNPRGRSGGGRSEGGRSEGGRSEGNRSGGLGGQRGGKPGSKRRPPERRPRSNRGGA